MDLYLLLYFSAFVSEFRLKTHLIDLFADTAAILLDLRGVNGCPGGMSTIRYTHSVYVRALFGPIFL